MALLLAKRNLIVFSTTIVVTMNGHIFPDAIWLIPLLVLALVCCRRFEIPMGHAVLLATVVSLVHVSQFVRQTNTLFNCGSDITIDVEIESTFKANLYFATSPVSFSGVNHCGSPVKGRLMLRVKHDTHQLSSANDQHIPFKLGEIWKVRVKLKPVRGLQNGVGFDLEKHFASRELLATAEVIEVVARVGKANLRGRVFEKFYQLSREFKQQPLMLALMFGERSEINSDLWEQLRYSGLAHLIAISGLHIGMAFGIGWGIGCAVRICYGRAIWLPFILAMGTALFYAWLAGFSVPTQRALLMCAIWSITCYAQLRLPRWHLLYLIVAVILALSPNSALDNSLWLSVGAVATLFVVTRVCVLVPYLVLRAIALQLLLSVALIPLSIGILGGFSVVSFVYNLVFIPLVSLIVVPALFLSFITMGLNENWARMILSGVDQLLSGLAQSLAWVSPELWIDAPKFITATVLIAILGGLILYYRHWLLLCLLLTASSYQAPLSWKLDVLDVGHGLAVLVHRNGKALLYDTGASWSTGSMAKQVVMPVLNYESLDLEGMFVSHWDNDHSGGATIISDSLAPPMRFSSQQQSGYLPCLRGMHWWWEGLTVRILWPPITVYRAYNPHSCVIEISDGQHTVLLTGDINLLVEYQLQKQLSAVDVVLVPHHGSVTSSSWRFIERIKPKVAIASASAAGKWQFPAPKIKQRYLKSGSNWLDTAQYGRVEVRFFHQNMSIRTYRGRQYEAWYRQILRKGVE
ncbi:DNA internalization-related competence protein ComEC/Rec2 [Vibrio gallicus]|uniref:DNA internalization-related competence protein ComEC/Rec2 n=1 Tax=Vibrio gallicus TaxID=190897 RepID=UPI0021C46ADD|nr:DNA internalization-related competence protein ComEC/Rec2 [Vibrio gallicus]